MNLSMGSHSFDVNRWIQCFEQLGVINGWQFLKENSKTQGYNLQDLKNIMAGFDSQEITSGTSSRRYINERIINRVKVIVETSYQKSSVKKWYKSNQKRLSTKAI